MLLPGEMHLGQALKNLTLLQNLDLNFIRCGMAYGEGMHLLCVGLKYCTSLQCLGLNFAHYNFSDDEMSILWRTLKTLTLLQKLKLHLPNSEKIFGKGNNLERAFRSLVALKSLDMELRFDEPDIVDDFNEVLKALRSVEDVLFHFRTFKNCKKEDVEKKLRQTLKILPCLKDLDLRVY